jgi:hypothetical protein
MNSLNVIDTPGGVVRLLSPTGALPAFPVFGANTVCVTAAIDLDAATGFVSIIDLGNQKIQLFVSSIYVGGGSDTWTGVTGPQIISYVVTGTTAEVWIGGVSKATVAYSDPGATTLTNTQVGRSSAMNGAWGEIMIYDDSTDRAAAESAATTRWIP